MIEYVYDFEEFKMDCFAFNELAGKDTQHSFADLANQFLLIKEETKELGDALQGNDAIGVLDGAVDVLVVTLGMLQKLKAAGFNVSKALQDTAQNNLSKFPASEDVAIRTAQFYQDQGIEVSVSYNMDYDLFVVKDQNDKVRKPIDFTPNCLKDCVPVKFLEKGFYE